MTNLQSPISNTVFPADGKSYYFATHTVEDTDVDLLSGAITSLGKTIVHVKIGVTTAGIVGISVNGAPEDPANGKAVQLSLPWEGKMPFSSLSCVRTAGSDPITVEVEAWSGE